MKDLRPTTILMAEDDPDDRLLTQDAMEASGFDGELRFVANGDELLAYLRRQGKYGTEAAPTPRLILLDLNMPGKDGREALEELKADPELCGIPVVVLTTSDEPEDIRRSYAKGASSYITKPSSFQDLVETLSCLSRYWFRTVELPALN